MSNDHGHAQDTTNNDILLTDIWIGTHGLSFQAVGARDQIANLIKHAASSGLSATLDILTVRGPEKMTITRAALVTLIGSEHVYEPVSVPYPREGKSTLETVMESLSGNTKASNTL